MNESTPTQAVESRLTALRAAYQQRLDGELVSLQTHVEALTERPDSIDALQFMHKALHKLAGSAGTFGFEQLGRRAKELEHFVAEALNAEQSVLEPLELETWVNLLKEGLLADVQRGSALGVEVVSTRLSEEQPSIWLLERDPMLADYIAQQLRSFGFSVEHLNDAQELSQSHAHSPDLLLVDHRASESPELNENPERFWRERLQPFQCPIIFTGAEESFSARLHAVRSGGRGYFAKPLDVPQLASHVARVLKSQDAEPERVLIVEDDAEMAQFCQLVLERAGMQVQVLHHPKELIQTASDFNPELVLMDLWLPEATGAEMVALLTQVERWAHLPVVYLSAETNPELRTQAMVMGGDAFLEKPVDPVLLVSLCRSRVGRLRELEHAMSRDGLTGLMKHASIKEALEAEWEYVRRHPRYFSVVMLDIDHFKAVNDSYGHAVGDLVIASVGTLLRQHFRTTDKLGRYGGEEFALVLPDCTANKAVSLVDKLREAFSAIKFMGDGKVFSCTLSAGVVDNECFPNDSAEALIERADQALYRAKHSGRNQVCQAIDSGG